MAGLKPILIGIAGGSGSGKTYFARSVRDRSPAGAVSVFSIDKYFRTETSCEPAQVNFDHPSHIDLDLVLEHLAELRSGRPVSMPHYDFRTMAQSAGAQPLASAPIVLVEGLFVLAHPIVDLLDLTCFLDVADDQRLLGRILRDLEERGATIQMIVDRYQRFVRPSYSVFVAPTKHNAHIVVDFTFRRAFFTEMLVEFVSDYVHGRVSVDEYLRRVNAESYRLGYRADEAVMPMTVDIRDLARAYPETQLPTRIVYDPEAKPRLYLENHADLDL